MAVLECRQLHFSYPDNTCNALNGLSLLFNGGSFSALLGPNGAGKSTLLRLLAGLYQPSMGTVLLNGQNLSSLSTHERARSIAYLPQSVHFAFPITVRECVEMGRYVYSGFLGRLSREDRIHCDRALDLCDASAFADRMLDSLSGGERQRVLLASALAQSPLILLLDEPTLSLDLPHQEGFFKVVRELHRNEGLTVIVATHELNLASRNADRLVLLSQGKVDCDGPASRVLTPSRISRVFKIRMEKLRGPRGASVLVPSENKKARR
jgi:iron complex transport system ATP-binding protein